MGLVPIDRTRWPRRAHYEWVQKTGQGPFAVTVPLDVTLLAGEPLYPALLWLLTQGVNEMEAFRTVATPEGLGIYDHMDPAYTVFHPQEKTFSVLWTPFHPDYQVFRAAYQRDVAAYGASPAWMPQGVRPENTFDVSMVPWMSFSAFHLAATTERPYLLPIFTLGKWVSQRRRGSCPSRYKSIRGCAIPSTFISCRCGSRRALRGFPAGEKALDFPGRAVYNKGTTL